MKGIKDIGTGGLMRITSPLTLEIGDAFFIFTIPMLGASDGLYRIRP